MDLTPRQLWLVEDLIRKEWGSVMLQTMYAKDKEEPSLKLRQELLADILPQLQKAKEELQLKADK